MATKNSPLCRDFPLLMLAVLLTLFAAACTAASAQVTSSGDINPVYTSTGTLQNNGLAIDRLGNIYSSDYFTSSVHVFDTQGNVTDVPSGAQAFKNPNGIAIDSSWTVYIADTDNNRVMQCLSGVVPLQLSTAPFPLNKPTAIAVDAAGNKFILDSGNNRVLRIAAQGTNRVVSLAGFNGAGMNTLAVSPDGTTLYIAFGSNSPTVPNSVLKVSNVNNVQTTSSVVKIIGLTQPALLEPAGLAVDPDGFLYIADSQHGRILQLTPGANPVASILTGFGFDSFDWGRPSALALDSGGTLYVADPFRDHVMRVALHSENFGRVPVGYSSPHLYRTVSFKVGSSTTLGGARIGGQKATATDFKITSNTCTAGLTNTTCSVQVGFTPSSASLHTASLQLLDNSQHVVFSMPLYGTGNGSNLVVHNATGNAMNLGALQPQIKSGVWADGQGNLWIADTFNNRVLKTDLTQGTTTQVSTGALTLAWPRRVVVDPNGNIFIADSNNNRIVKVPVNGSPSALPLNGLTLQQPQDLAMDGAGNLYIADTFNSRIVEVPSSSPGNAFVVHTGKTLMPIYSLAVDYIGTIYFTQTPSVPLMWIPRGGEAYQYPTPGVSFGNLAGIAVDASLTLYVADAGNGKLIRVTAGGTEVMSTPGITLSSPGSVTTDAAGNIYFSDMGQNVLDVMPRGNPNPLKFATTGVGQTSIDSPKNVVLANVGPDTANLGSITVPPQFLRSNTTCGNNIGASYLCSFYLSFKPLAVGPQAGNVVQNYTAAVINVPGSITIPVSGTGAVAQTINFPFGQSSVTYGAAPIPLTATATSALPVQYSILSGPGKVVGNTLVITGAGQIVVAANQPGNSTYAPAAQVTHSLTVLKAVLPVSANGFTTTYGSPLPVLTWSVSNLQYQDTKATALTGAPILGTVVTSKTGVGTYTLVISGGSLHAANYNIVLLNGLITVYPANLKVSAVSTGFTYGNANFPILKVAYSGWMNGDTVGTATTGAPQITTSATPHSAVGPYPIMVAPGTLHAANYKIVTANGTLTVNPATLTITAVSTSRKRHTRWAAFQFAVSGLVNSDTQATAFTGNPVFSTVATPASPANKYSLNVTLGTLSSKNYTFNFVAGTLTVTN